MSVAASLLERGAPESTGGGDGACDEVQAVQAERSAEMHLQCATGVDAGALEEPMDMEYEWRGGAPMSGQSTGHPARRRSRIRSVDRLWASSIRARFFAA